METMKIHEIPGFRFGQVEDLEGGTGCTVILCPGLPRHPGHGCTEPGV